MKPVLILRNELPDPGGVALEELQAAGLDVRMIDVFQGAQLPELREISGAVVLGGSQHADDVEHHPYLKDEQEFLHEATERDVPILAFCLGGQILAMAKGATLHLSRHREFGYTPIEPTDEGRRDPLFSVWEPGDRVFHWHEDMFDLPRDATLLLQGDRVRNQAFRYGESAWGMQFHPEVTEHVIDIWLEVAGDTTEQWGKSPEAIREENRLYLAQEERQSREMMRRFVGVLRSRA